MSWVPKPKSRKENFIMVPALIISNLELQLDRIQQLSMSMWVTAFQSKSFVADMLMILATGKSESATYSPSESHSHEGGFLVNEAA